MSIQPSQPLWSLYDLSSRCIRSSWCFDWCIGIWRVWFHWLRMNDWCTYEESSQTRFCFTTCPIDQLVIYIRDPKERTRYRAVIQQQVVDLPDVDRLDHQHDPLFSTGTRSDSLVSFSSLNEHNLALSGCCITLKEYILPSELFKSRWLTVYASWPYVPFLI